MLIAKLIAYLFLIKKIFAALFEQKCVCFLFCTCILCLFTCKVWLNYYIHRSRLKSRGMLPKSGLGMVKWRQSGCLTVFLARIYNSGVNRIFVVVVVMIESLFWQQKCSTLLDSFFFRYSSKWLSNFEYRTQCREKKYSYVLP